MCGIVGAFRPGSTAAPLEVACIEAARDRMVHRGPDGAGLFTAAGGRLALGHRRLALIDLTDTGAQPMTDVECGLTIVFNGEIYNHRELRSELETAGAVFRGRSDTEVLLRLYALQGVAGLARLNGMFAFALWDERRQGLLLARDGLGIKPLYHFDDGETVGFASECRALSGLLPAHLAQRADPAARVGFFLYGWVPEPLSPWAGIRMLPAGSWLWIEGSRRRKGRFFDLTEEIVSAEESARSAPRRRREDLLADLHDGVASSVSGHLIADVPVALFLSAGVDSAMIAELSAGGAAAAITLAADRFAGSADDETAGAAATAASCGLSHLVRRLDASDFAGQREALMAVMDSPTIDGVNTFFVARATRDCGFKAALSGVGGDEMLGGYPSFRQIPRLTATLGPLARLPLAGAALGRGLRRLAARPLSAFTSPKYASLLELAGGAADAYLLRRGLFLPWELQMRETDVDEETLARVAEAMGGDGRYERIASPHLRVLALESELYMRGQLLRDADWAGMASSLEIRTPLADAALVRRAVGLIARMEVPPDKRSLAALVGPASRMAAARPKTGFSLPIRQWLAETGPSPASSERGLRGWSRFVYDEWCRRNGLTNQRQIPDRPVCS